MAPYPALFPPADGGHHTWPAPNYIDPEQRGWGAPAGIIAMSVVTSVVVAARLWARFCIKRTVGVDDWLIIASMVGGGSRGRVEGEGELTVDSLVFWDSRFRLSWHSVAMALGITSGTCLPV
jgi:hypothetical protein